MKKNKIILNLGFLGTPLISIMAIASSLESTTPELGNLAILNTRIQGLNDNILTGKADSTQLPSAIKKATVLSWVKALNSIKSLTNEQKALLFESDISLVHDDNAGTLVVTITNHGNNKVFDTIIGFKTNTTVLEETIGRLSESALDGKGDDTKFPSAITETIVLNWIKALADISSLDGAQKNLLTTSNISLNQDDNEGTLTVTITGYGDDKAFTAISGFKANAKILEAAIGRLSKNALDGKGDDTKFPSAITDDIVLTWIKALADISSLDDAQKNLLTTSNISLNQDDNEGTLTVTITGYGDDKAFTAISGFKANARVLENAIQTLLPNALDGKGDLTKFPSAITEIIVLNWIKALADISSLTNPQKDLLTKNDVSVRANNDKGTLIVTITNHGDNKVFDAISGFKTTNLDILETEIYNLAEDAINKKGDSTKLPSVITKTSVLTWIKALANISILTNAQKDLLVEDNINLAHNDNAGTLTVTITNHGDNKVFSVISGFKTNAKVLENAIQKLLPNALSRKGDLTKFPSAITETIVLTWIKALDDISILTDPQKDLLDESDISFAYDDNAGTLIVTIANHGDNKVFSVISGFKTNARVLEGAIQALLPNALDGKGDPTKFSSAITKAIVLVWIKTLDGISALTNPQKDLLAEIDINLANNYVTGILNVSINNHGNVKEWTISGFKSTTQSNVDIIATTIQNLNDNAMDGIIKIDNSKLPSTVTQANVISWIRTLDSIDGLTNDQKKLFDIGNIKLEPNDKVGNLTITIVGHGNDKVFNAISGFNTNANVIKTTIQNLHKSILYTQADSTKLASEITRKTVLGWIKAISTIANLRNDQKTLIVENDIIINANNDDGILTITITNHGPNKILIIANFQTTHAANVKKLDEAIQSLKNSEFQKYVSKKILPSQITKRMIFEWVKSTKAFSSLTKIQKDLFNELKIRSTTAKNGLGEFFFSIWKSTGYKSFYVGGWKKSAKHNIEKDKEKFISFKKIFVHNSDPLPDGSITADNLIALAGHGPLPSATSGVTRTFSIANDISGVAKVTITFTSKAMYLTRVLAKYELSTTYTIIGFKINAKVLETEIQKLDANVLDGKANSNNYPSTISREIALGWIKAISTIDSLTSDQKELLKIDDISLSSDYISGTLTLTIKNHGEDKKLIITGFRNASQDDIDAIRAAIQKLDPNVLDSKSNSNKLPSTITKSVVLGWIKAIESINSLTNDQKVLFDLGNINLNYNDEIGTLTIMIVGHGNDKTFDTIKGLITNHQALEIEIQKLDPNVLDSNANDSKLPNEFTKTTVLGWVKAISTIANLPSDQKELLKIDDISLSSDYISGTLTLTIKNHGKDKKLIITGFKNASQDDVETLKITIQHLNAKILNSKNDSRKIPSIITKATVLGWIKAISAISNLTNNQKALLIESNILLEANDNVGTLIVTIVGHGNDKSFTIKGFMTNSKALEIEIQKLDVDILNSNVDITGVPSGFKKANALNWIKNIKSINSLTSDQKKLLKVDDISLSSDYISGTLTLIIKNHGKDKKLIITSFKSNLLNDINALAFAIKSLNANELNSKSDSSILPSKVMKSTVLGWIKAISTIGNLTSDQKALLNIGHISLDANDSSGTLAIKIIFQKINKAFDVISGFQTSDQVKPIDASEPSSGLSSGIVAGITIGSIFGAEILAYLAFFFIRKYRSKK